MNKKLAKFIGGTLIGISLLTVSASARQIGNLNSFELPKWQTIVSTEYLVKSTTNAPWVLNITNLSGTTSIHAYLTNSNNERRSDYVVTRADRKTISSNGQAGYKYKATFLNDYSIRGSAYVSGSWSPDDK